MPEYIYLLENRLSTAQKHALTQVREAAREAGMTVFLTGGAVRDLTTGSSVRNFNFSVQGNALELEQALVARGATLWGVHEPTRTLTLWFPGSVRADVASTRAEEYPKPGKPVYHWSTIVEDLRRRDFTANAMALSLNEGSYGLLLDPLNGVADIEARLLRVASNYGFLEDPSRLIRVTRLKKRLGWQFEERTATRYANAKESDAIDALSPYLRGSEIEKVASEEDALDILKELDAEGWTEHLFPGWSNSVADLAGLDSLRRNWIQLLMQGVIADLTAAHLELLTSGFSAKQLTDFKAALVHPGLVQQWEGLEEAAKEFAKLLTGKAAAQPSATWKLFTTHPAEPVLWLAHTRKAGAADAKFKSFFTVWSEFKKRVPAAMMLEMRITPELPGYTELLEQLFYQLIDGNLETDEQMRAFLEPWSPPAPPPPPTVRRSRAKKSESKTKRRISAPDEDDDEDRDDDDEDGDDAEDEVEVEDEEIVEDEVLSTVLDKLHADESEEAPGEDEDELPSAADEEEPAEARPAGRRGAGSKVAKHDDDASDDKLDAEPDELVEPVAAAKKTRQVAKADPIQKREESGVPAALSSATSGAAPPSLASKPGASMKKMPAEKPAPAKATAEKTAPVKAAPLKAAAKEAPAKVSSVAPPAPAKASPVAPPAPAKASPVAPPAPAKSPVKKTTPPPEPVKPAKSASKAGAAGPAKPAKKH